MIINLVYDAAAQAAPQSFRDGILEVVMRHHRSDRSASLIRMLLLDAMKAIRCGGFVVLAGFALMALAGSAANAQDYPPCPADIANAYPPVSDIPYSVIEVTEGTYCYIGHDEPIVSFYSTVPGSASNITWEMVLPVEKVATANTYNSNTPAPAQTYQNYAHFQFYLVLCDPNSSTQNVQVACTPNSDSNPSTAGASLLELKFIPPGEPTNAPFGGFNCSNLTTTQWCAIAQIQINTNQCGVPLNEGWITTNGQPPQPVFNFPQPAAQGNTLLMNQGDRIRVILTDSANGLLIVVIDETTHQTGFVQTSAANGFRSSDAATCTTVPFTFRPLWNTASCKEAICGGVAHGYNPFGDFASYLNVSWGLEIGHSETSPDGTDCHTTTNSPPGTWCFGQDDDVDGATFQAAAWPPGANGPGSAVQIISPIGKGFGPTTSIQLAGTPGSANCHGKSVSALAEEFGGLAQAADTLGFASVKALQDAIKAFCDGDGQPMQLYPQIRLHAGSGEGAFDANAATFYPYYSLLQPDLYTPNGEAAPPPCALVIGNFVKGSNNSINDFGQSDQYGQKPNRGQQQPVITRPICGGG